MESQPWHLIRLERVNEWSGESLCGLLPTAYVVWPQRWVAAGMPADGICTDCLNRLVAMPSTPLEARRDIVDGLLETVFDPDEYVSPDAIFRRHTRRHFA